MRRLPIALVAASAAVGLAAAPAAAISTYNSQDAPERTEVGAFMALWDRDDDGIPDRFAWVCSGAMVDEDTFLTAAHCTDDWPTGTRFFVSLEQDVQPKLDGLDGDTPSEQAQAFLDDGWAVEGDTHQDPAFPGPASDTHDIGVIDFADRQVKPADVWAFTPATLPTANQLSELGSRALDAATWWVVGYGTEEALRGPGGQTHPDGGTRKKAELGFNSLHRAWASLAMNESRGYGGACYGDSGGPNYVELDGTFVLAGTTITGDSPCYATNVVHRTDTASSRAFLANYVDLP